MAARSSQTSEREEAGIRMGCGFLFGSVAAFSTLASWTDWPLCCAAAVLVGLLVAFLAPRFGDSLWKAIIRFMSWW